MSRLDSDSRSPYQYRRGGMGDDDGFDGVRESRILLPGYGTVPPSPEQTFVPDDDKGLKKKDERPESPFLCSIRCNFSY